MFMLAQWVKWGGSVFFLNKKTNKVYSYPSTDVQQVLKFKDNYIVSNSSRGFSGFLSISDPTKLFELKEEIQKTYCNWYVTVDSLKHKKWAGISLQRGVKSYVDTFGVKTLTTFPFNNELYSIYSTDSATILAKHKDFKLVTVDTLLKKSIIFYEASTHLANNFFITAYRASWYVGYGNDKQLNHKNSGLIFMQGNTIRFLEFNSY